MRWLIWYIKSCFCSHSFKYEESDYTIKNSHNQSIVKNGPVVSVTCTKCGYHKTYWKFG